MNILLEFEKKNDIFNDECSKLKMVVTNLAKSMQIAFFDKI